MPDWVRPDPSGLFDDDNELDKIATWLNDRVRDNPSMADVVGVDAEMLTTHAAKATAAYLIYMKASANNPISPSGLITVYNMGFVVGVRYQQSREKNDGQSEEGTSST